MIDLYSAFAASSQIDQEKIAPSKKPEEVAPPKEPIICWLSYGFNFLLLKTRF